VLTLRRQQCRAAIVHAGEAARVLRRIRQCADDASGVAAIAINPWSAPVSIEVASETGWKRMRDSGS